MNQGVGIAAGSASIAQRQEFGATEVVEIRETAGAAVAAREKAAVEARYIVALRNPRNLQKCEDRLIGACKDPDFAEEAWYRKPVGSKFDQATGQWVEEEAEGFSIRFAEEALAAYGNVYPELMVSYESDEFRIVRNSITDLENNVCYSADIVVKKQVERRKLKKGQLAIAERKNSSGDKVFIVAATDDEIGSKQNNLRSKAMRTDGLRLIPQAIKAKCKRQILATQTQEIKQDLSGTIKKMVEKFAQQGVSQGDLEIYLGHPVAGSSQNEIIDLRKTHNALRDHETTWEAVMEQKNPAGTIEAAARVAEEKLGRAAAQQAEPDPAEPERGRKQKGFDL